MVDLAPGAVARIVNPSTVVRTSAPGVVKGFAVMAGPKGDKGDTGATGATGPTGPQGDLNAASAPTLALNRVPDPQAKTSGSSSSSTMTLTRITTGLPSGFAYGIQTVRTGTLSTTIAQAWIGDSTEASVLRIPVTAGEVISALGNFFTDQASARARLDLQFLNSSNGVVSTVQGTYANIAASTWETRTNTGVTVPAGATHVILLHTITTQSGGNTVTGAVGRFTGGMVVSGSVAAASMVYGDGTTAGWAWTGTAHASTSKQVLIPAAEAATLRAVPARVTTLETNTAGPLAVTKTGTAISISETFNGQSLVRSMNLTSSQNGAFGLVSVTLAGTTIHFTDDDVTPIRTQFGALGGNHGYPNVMTFTNPDGKTTADLGSRWTDGTREYVLLAFQSGKLVLGGDYTTTSGVVNSAYVTPTTNLTHVAGATHTGAIDYTTGVADQLRPGTTGRITVNAWLDGKALTSDVAAFPGRELVVRESYDVYDYASIYDTAKANVGVSYATLSVAGCVRVSNTFRFNSGGRCRVSTTAIELRPTTLGQCGAVQSAVMSKFGATITRYLPGVGSLGGFDWTAGVDLTSYNSSLIVTTSDLAVAGKPPVASLDVMTESSATTIGFAMGYLPIGLRGDELSTSANRITHAATKLWDLRNTKKNYPTFTNAENAGWGRVTAEAFRSYLTPTQVSTFLASKATPGQAYEALAAATNLG